MGSCDVGLCKIMDARRKHAIMGLGLHNFPPPLITQQSQFNLANTHLFRLHQHIIHETVVSSVNHLCSCVQALKAVSLCITSWISQSLTQWLHLLTGSSRSMASWTF